MIEECIERYEYHTIHTSDNYFFVQYEFLLKNGTNVRFKEDEGNLYDIQVNGKCITNDFYANDLTLLANDLYITSLKTE